MRDSGLQRRPFSWRSRWRQDSKNLLQSRRARRIEVSYLATNLKWNADYVLTVARDDKAADVDGWVTVTNGSGTAFRNTKLQLVAGDLNRVYPASGRLEADERVMQLAANAAREMTQESFSATTRPRR